jgi:membrane associated rhomboid family serine protease
VPHSFQHTLLSLVMPLRINLPPLTRSLLVALVLFTTINIVLRPYSDWVSGIEKPITSTGEGAPYLAIIPGSSIIYPYVFLLATLVEENIFGLIFTGLTLFYGGRYLERAWGSKEFTKFMLFVAMIPNVLCFLLYVISFALSKNEAALYVMSCPGRALWR